MMGGHVDPELTDSSRLTSCLLWGLPVSTSLALGLGFIDRPLLPSIYMGVGDPVSGPHT